MGQMQSNGGKAAGQMTAALDRWDGEGGAPAMPWPMRADLAFLGETERRILENLGAALVGEWSCLPTDIQKAIFRRATMDRAQDDDALKTRIARFLHDHKGACLTGGCDTP